MESRFAVPAPEPSKSYIIPALVTPMSLQSWIRRLLPAILLSTLVAYTWLARIGFCAASKSIFQTVFSLPDVLVELDASTPKYKEPFQKLAEPEVTPGS